jgi:hypothetical protein
VSRTQRYIERVLILCALAEPERQLFPFPFIIPELELPEIPQPKQERSVVIVHGDVDISMPVLAREHSPGIIILDKPRAQHDNVQPLLEILRRIR